jgi:hypothetical protein
VPSTRLGPRYPNLAVTEKWGGWLDESNYQVTGQVGNTGLAEAEKVAVVVTLYDEQGHVVGARAVGIAADVFLPGAIAAFDVTLTPLGPVSRYSVDVQGWWVDYPTPAVPRTAEETPQP